MTLDTALCHCEHLTWFSGCMQKKMDQQCHCEGAAGDCGNLKLRNTKTVYFLRRSPSATLRVNSTTKQSRSGIGARFTKRCNSMIWFGNTVVKCSSQMTTTLQISDCRAMTKVVLLHLVNEYWQPKNRLPENLATPNLFIILSGKRLANIIKAD